MTNSSNVRQIVSVGLFDDFLRQEYFFKTNMAMSEVKVREYCSINVDEVFLCIKLPICD